MPASGADGCGKIAATCDVWPGLAKRRRRGTVVDQAPDHQSPAVRPGLGLGRCNVAETRPAPATPHTPASGEGCCCGVAAMLVSLLQAGVAGAAEASATLRFPNRSPGEAE